MGRDVNELLDMNEQAELKTLRLRVGDQRKELFRLKEITDSLVYCNECKYFKEISQGDDREHICTRLVVSAYRVEFGDFCSQGEKLRLFGKAKRTVDEV